MTKIADNRSYGKGAFQGKTSLTSVTLPSTLTYIGDYAFAATKITTLTIPSSVTEIGNGAFGGTPLTSVTIPNSVTTIGDSAFGSCTSLTSVSLGSGVQILGDYPPFEGCTSLTAYSVSSSNAYFSVSDGVLFNKDKTTLVSYPEGKTGTSYSVPNTVSEIGPYAFFKNTKLTRIILPTSLRYVRYDAFTQAHIPSITIPEGTLSLGIGVFSSEYIQSISIPSTLTTWEMTTMSGLPDNPLRSCTTLSNITVASNNQYFSSIDGVLYNKSHTILYSYPTLKTSPTYFSIPDTVTTIANYACTNNRYITKIFIGNGITAIGAHAFASCYRCTAIVFKGWNQPTMGSYSLSLAASSALTAEATVFSPDNWAQDAITAEIKGNAWTTLNYRNATPAVYIKSNGSWVRKGRGYLKINDVWVEDGTYFFKVDDEWQVLTYEIFGV